VEADQHRPPAGPDAPRQRRQQPVERAQLVVDGDPQRLKGPGGRVDRVPPAARPGHEAGWQHYVARLAAAGAGDDPGPDPGPPSEPSAL
jgi:hypothetical protein